MKRRFEHETVREFHHQVGTALALPHSPLDSAEARQLYDTAETLVADSATAYVADGTMAVPTTACVERPQGGSVRLDAIALLALLCWETTRGSVG